MPILSLGRDVDGLVLKVVRTDPFTSEIRTADASPWTVADVRVQFPGSAVADWVATVAGDTVTFNIDAATVDAAITADPPVCRLVGDGLTWAVGQNLRVDG